MLQRLRAVRQPRRRATHRRSLRLDVRRGNERIRRRARIGRRLQRRLAEKSDRRPWPTNASFSKAAGRAITTAASTRPGRTIAARSRRSAATTSTPRFHGAESIRPATRSSRNGGPSDRRRRRDRRRRPQRADRRRLLRASRVCARSCWNGATCWAARPLPSRCGRAIASRSPRTCAACSIRRLSPTWICAAHGYHAYRKEPASFTPLADGRSLLLGSDDAANAAEIARFEPRDVARFEAFETEAVRLGAALFDSFGDAQPSYGAFRRRDARRRSPARLRIWSSVTCARRCCRPRSRPTG